MLQRDEFSGRQCCRPPTRVMIPFNSVTALSNSISDKVTRCRKQNYHIGSIDLGGESFGSGE
jgi:hypothetical protein